MLRSTKNTLPVVAAKERILGFYSTGPRLREADLDISDLLSSYAESPLLLICEVQVCASGPWQTLHVWSSLADLDCTAAKGDGFADHCLLSQGADSRGMC